VAEGHQVSGLASHLDLLPTLFGILDWSQDADLEGSDWSDRVQGGAEPTDRTRAHIDTWMAEINRAGLYTPTHQCQIDFGSIPLTGKPVEAEFIEGCFEHQSDPTHRTPIARPELEAELRQWRREATASVTLDHKTDARDDPVQDARLKALGYVD
jgi:hypothetical protein